MLAMFFALAAMAAAPLPSRPERWVTDTAGVLQGDTIRALDRRLEAYQQATGHQVVVWVGRTLQGDTIEDWAARTFKSWGIGRRGQDDGLALFVFTDDRLARIEVGYGLEPVLTDLEAGRILDQTLIPAERAGDPDRAVTSAVGAILTKLGGETGPGDQAEQRAPAPQSPWRGIATAVVLALVLLLAIRNPWLALMLLSNLGGSRRGGGLGGGGGLGTGGGGGFSGGGGSSGGGGASRGW